MGSGGVARGTHACATVQWVWPNLRAMPTERAFRVLDSDYPAVLRELATPPDPLWVRGELPRAPAVAIVGTRDASPEALKFARALGRLFAEAGVAVFSGGAAGIDAAAHEGALDGGGATVVVAGTGVDHVFPKDHAPLFEKIVESGGAIVSPFERDQRGARWTFLRRNPVLAALTNALVLVEAPVKSGARSAAAAARRLGRPLFVVPGAPWDPLGAGGFLELCLGATPLTSEVEIFSAIGLAPPTRAEPLLPLALGPARSSSTGQRGGRERAPSALASGTSPGNGLVEMGGRQAVLALPDDLSPTTLAVWEATSEQPAHADDLCVRTKLSSPVVHEALLTLILHAVLVEGPSGCFRRASV